MKAREITVGGYGHVNKIVVGGSAPVTIQTMWKDTIVDVTEDSEKLHSILTQINDLKALGCDIIRFAVPDVESALALRIIQSHTDVPLVADIHFDYRLALECLKEDEYTHVAVIRINPGNIGSVERVKAVVDACKEKNVPIRIGVNTGSIPKEIEEEVIAGKISRAKALVKTALNEVSVFDELGFKEYAVSMKASSVSETVEANTEFAKVCDAPLHIGVTEAGPLITGVVKSTLAFSKLLLDGIGSTIRVSLSSTPENEVITAREILHECGLRKGGVTLVSCPRCGRIGFDVHDFVSRWQKELLSIDKEFTVAIMGCVVNGPGEGKHADLGIAGGKDKVIIFKKGKIIHTIDSKDADKVFRQELELLINNDKNQ